MSITVVTPAATLAVPYDLFAKHCWVNTAKERSLADFYLAQSQDMVERYTRLTLIRTTFEYASDCKEECFNLPRSPFVQVVSFKDENGDEYTDYTITGDSPAHIKTKKCQKYTVRFKAGYATDEDVPPVARGVIMAVGYDLYTNRGDILENIKKATTVPHGFEFVCDGLRV